MRSDRRRRLHPIRQFHPPVQLSAFLCGVGDRQTVHRRAICTYPVWKRCTVNSDPSRKLDLECAGLASGCVDLGGELGAALESEILRLSAGHPPQQGLEARRKLELECLRTAASCTQLADDVQNYNLQKRLLELARQLTTIAETARPGFAKRQFEQNLLTACAGRRPVSP
jgi:hypothetical protein